MRRIELAILYFCVLTPAALALRLVHDPLHLRWRPDVATYWIRKGRRWAR